MTSLVHQEQPSVTRRDLIDAGFTPEQIATLEEMRANYPFVEYLDSRKELQRLRFMKWMIGRERTTGA